MGVFEQTREPVCPWHKIKMGTGNIFAVSVPLLFRCVCPQAITAEESSFSITRQHCI